jgi:cobalt-zinc-cadmium resistance protein CzcA
MAVLDQLGRSVAGVVRGVRGATDVDAFEIGGATELTIRPDRARLARYGLAINDVNTLINEAMAGAGVNSVFEADRRFDVVVRIARPFRTAIDDIARLQIPLPGTLAGNGPSSIALGDVADIEVRAGASRIQRELGARTMVVKANLIDRDQGSFVDEAQAKVASQVKLPAGYHLTWGGQFENSQRAAKRLQVIVPITALMIFCLLFWAFRSVRLAALTLGMVPFTMLGGLAALGLAGLHLSVSAAVGFIAVAGISVQNSVIMVEEVLDRVRGGARVRLAVIEGATLRLRPILMTALMAGLGLLPAALSHGIGSETQRPFACVIVGGIVSGTLFTLLMLPLVLSMYGRLTEPDSAPRNGEDAALDNAAGDDPAWEG